MEVFGTIVRFFQNGGLFMYPIVIILAIAVALLCPLGLLIWYLRLPAERRAAMWNARLEVIGAAPKATAAA